MRIGLLTVLRDEAKALPRFFKLLEALESDQRVERLFCSFYENDSSDGTPDLLAEWIKNRPGVLQSEQIGAPRLRGREISRTVRMAEARNQALAGFSEEPLDWLVIIDADLYVYPSHIWQLIEVVQGGQRVAMACASALQNMPDIFGRSPWSYYDSYALLDSQNRLGITGALIHLRDLDDRAKWMSGRPVPVKAEFGGIAVVPMTTVCSKGLRWDGSQGCEHWSFCIEAGEAGQVLACPQVTPLVLHDSPRRWSEGYQQRRKRELKQLWRQAIF